MSTEKAKVVVDEILLAHLTSGEPKPISSMDVFAALYDRARSDVLAELGTDEARAQLGSFADHAAQYLKDLK